MTHDEFRASLGQPAPPALPPILQALWYVARSEWNKAHELAQANDSEPLHNWLHAYLHRQEGDLSNAAYWYRRAGRPVFSGSLADELHALLQAGLTA